MPTFECSCPSAGQNTQHNARVKHLRSLPDGPHLQDSLRQASCCTLPQPHRVLGFAAAAAGEALVALYGAWRQSACL